MCESHPRRQHCGQTRMVLPIHSIEFRYEDLSDSKVKIQMMKRSFWLMIVLLLLHYGVRLSFYWQELR